MTEPEKMYCCGCGHGPLDDDRPATVPATEVVDGEEWRGEQPIDGVHLVLCGACFLTRGGAP